MATTSNISTSPITIREQLLRQFFGGIPREIYASAKDYMNSNEYREEVERYGKSVVDVYQGLCAINELVPIIVDYLAYEVASIKYADIDDSTLNEADVRPISNIEGFDILKSLTDSDLLCAILDMTKDENLRYDLYNCIKEDDYDGYKMIIKQHALSTIKVNKKLNLVKLCCGTFEQGAVVVDKLESSTKQEVDIVDNIHLPRILKASKSAESSELLQVINSEEFGDSENAYLEIRMLTRFILSQIYSIINTVNEVENSALNKYERQVLESKQLEGFKFIIDSGIDTIDLSKVNANDLQKISDAYKEYDSALSKDVESEAKSPTIVITDDRDSDTNIITSSDNRRMPFSTRIETNTIKVSSDYYIPIFEEIYKVYGNRFENMSLPEFLYFWGATNKRPKNYNPPYYWVGDEGTMKAFLRILYVRQPRILKKLLRYAPDKAEGIEEHDWGRNKDSVPYLDIQDTIQAIFKDITKTKLDPL